MILRKCTMIDAPIIHKELGCNPAMLRYTGWNPYRTLESTMDFLSHTLNSEEDNSWIIEVDGNVVGTIGAYNYCAEDASIELSGGRGLRLIPKIPLTFANSGPCSRWQLPGNALGKYPVHHTSTSMRLSKIPTTSEYKESSFEAHIMRTLKEDSIFYYYSVNASSGMHIN